jgi:hypothetical protein
MPASYEIFDLVSGNVLDVYDCEGDALDALADIALERGTAEVGRFALFRESDSNSALVAMKDDLVQLVLATRRGLLVQEPVASSG